MPEYEIRIIRRGDPLVAVEGVTGTKRMARERAEWLARVTYPDATRYRWDGDARMAFSGDDHLGDVSVEPAAIAMLERREG